ncbi:MAG TPA: FAD-dependent oxidoreductase, partial [Armatimonadota bacterium]|nr:FAD-dependent oxidoreductase [Armatimonadota bacterium]
VDRLIVRNLMTGSRSELKVDGVFVLIGQEPDTEFIGSQVILDDFGYILTDTEMRTNIPGVFAAGDVRQKTFRQIVTACADGAIAANSAEKYVEAVEAGELVAAVPETGLIQDIIGEIPSPISDSTILDATKE